jgi:DNA helicase INO80
MWLADDEQAEMIERREKELLESGEYEKQKKKPGKRKRTDAPASLDEMYHEGKYIWLFQRHLVSNIDTNHVA